MRLRFVIAATKLLNSPFFFCKFPGFSREKRNHDLTALPIPAMSRLKAQTLHIAKNDRWAISVRGELNDIRGKNPEIRLFQTVDHGQSGRISGVLERGFLLSRQHNRAQTETLDENLLGECF